MIAYIAGRVRAWVATHVVAPHGSTYDQIDQEIEGRAIVPTRWQ